MKSFVRRRTTNLTLTALLAAILLGVWFLLAGTLRSGSFTSGWALFGAIVFLAMYNVRKMFSFLPLGSSTHWLQLHIYIGLLTFLIFAIHVNFTIPNGFFECLLAAVYLLVFVSGLIGLYMTRTYPKRLTDLGEEFIFETIPVLKREVRERLDAHVLDCESTPGQTEIPQFYLEEIHPFTIGRPDYLSHLAGEMSREYRSVRKTIQGYRRYMNADEQHLMDTMEKLIERKYQLDIAYTLQGALKIWLFVHIPATYSLLIFGFFHSLLVYAWSGGLL